MIKYIFNFSAILLLLITSTFAEKININNTTKGASYEFLHNQENIDFELSHSYTSVAVKIKNQKNIIPIILVSNNSGKNWHMLNFDTDSQTNILETQDSQFLYSNLVFFKKNTESNNFRFKTKLFNTIAKNNNTLEFSFFKDDTTNLLQSSNTSLDAQTHLGYSRDEWFFAENNIVRREDWGANETYRYKTQAEKKAEQNVTKKPTPLSNRAKKCNTTIKNNPQDFVKSEIIYNDSNGELNWPYQYSPEIKKIIIHHTGTNNSKYSGQSAEEVMRATYKFHANIKNWGDIGYHFIISPNGTIFEGKAGGDFIIGGHAYCANTQTIGISLMGNYEDEHLNDMQIVALKNLIISLSKKYNLDPATQSTFLEKYTYNLVGHKDYGQTLCPGKNVYKYMSVIREATKNLDITDPTQYSSQKIITPAPTPTPTPQITVIPRYISPASLIFRPTIGNTNNTKNIISHIQTPLDTQSIYPKITPPNRDIRIKLSHSSDLIQIKGHNMNIEINNTSKTIKKRRVIITTRTDKFKNTRLYIDGKQVNKIRISNKNYSEPLEIASWSRPLAWDTSKNDNLFLGILEIQIINNTLVIINELPLEDYIKGIAEVSNSAPTEKQKVIAVISRTYAQFYMNPTHTKFPNMPYDGDDTPEAFQKYRGYGYQKRSPLFTQAVNNTKFQVVTYEGKLIKTPFFSESAGITLSAQEKWGWTHTPYLQSVNDIFCKNGQGQLKGHGVGLSGCGAKTMALLGHSYINIIQYYYKGVEVQ